MSRFVHCVWRSRKYLTPTMIVLALCLCASRVAFFTIDAYLHVSIPRLDLILAGILTSQCAITAIVWVTCRLKLVSTFNQTASLDGSAQARVRKQKRRLYCCLVTTFLCIPIVVALWVGRFSDIRMFQASLQQQWWEPSNVTASRCFSHLTSNAHVRRENLDINRSSRRRGNVRQRAGSRLHNGTSPSIGGRRPPFELRIVVMRWWWLR